MAQPAAAKWPPIPGRKCALALMSLLACHAISPQTNAIEEPTNLRFGTKHGNMTIRHTRLARPLNGVRLRGSGVVVNEASIYGTALSGVEQIAGNVLDPRRVVDSDARPGRAQGLKDIIEGGCPLETHLESGCWCGCVKDAPPLILATCL